MEKEGRFTSMELSSGSSDLSDDDSVQPFSKVQLSVLQSSGYKINLDQLNSPEESQRFTVETTGNKETPPLITRPNLASKPKRKQRCDEKEIRQHKNITCESQLLRTCDICDKLFSRISNMQAHRRSHLGPTILCTYQDCSKKFINQKTLSQHIKSVHLGEKQTCRICKKTYSNRGSLFKHMRSAHEKNHR